MARRVVLSPEALADLNELSDYIAARGGEARAAGYVDRIETYCRGLADFPHRGIARDDVWPGLRLLGFERRATVVFRIASDTVTILRILHRGRDVGAAFS